MQGAPVWCVMGWCQVNSPVSGDQSIGKLRHSSCGFLSSSLPSTEGWFGFSWIAKKNEDLGRASVPALNIVNIDVTPSNDAYTDPGRQWRQCVVRRKCRMMTTRCCHLVAAMVLWSPLTQRDPDH